MSKRFFLERGNPKVAWDAGVNAGPVQIALNYNIPTVFYAEHGESEYGGHVLSEEHKKQRDINEFLEHLVGDDPVNWVSGNEIKESDLSPYIFPDQDSLGTSSTCLRAQFSGSDGTSSLGPIPKATFLK